MLRNWLKINFWFLEFLPKIVFKLSQQMYVDVCAAIIFKLDVIKDEKDEKSEKSTKNRQK